ncbi:MAG: tRNA uridine-5-carboxymethylaminomethyl(34) synthesis GTPase MnmE [Hyphomicrobiaceae bacterium]
MRSDNLEASTIFALSSAPGRSAIAVIRISGPGVLRALQALGVRDLKPRLASFRRLMAPHTNHPLDNALVLYFRAPHSATGEDVAELHVHGGRAVVAAVVDALARLPGLTPAEPGAFARRAFANGKLDLTSAEGLADLIDAETEAQRRQALAQASGELGRLYAGWRDDLVEAMALVEAAIDFSDEGDIGGETFERGRERVSRLACQLSAHLSDGRRGEILRDGFRIVLAGPVNAGKSTLLNWLAQRDVAITSEEAGTTRDVIEVRLDLGGFPVIVADTAGLRETESPIEREGMRRSKAQIAAADLVLWLVPSDGTEPGSSGADVPDHSVELWKVQTKADLAPDQSRSVDAISVKTGVGLEALMQRLLAAVRARVGERGEPVITQSRHRALVTSAHHHLERFLLKDPTVAELAAEDLRLAASDLGRLTGAVDPEEVLGAIFGRFCIGK